MDFKEQLANIIAKELKDNKNKIIEKIEVPPDPKLGDFALPCFIFPSQGKPPEVALKLSKKIKAPFIERIETKGPYLNFFLKTDTLAKEVLSSLKKKPTKTQKTILVELAGPNTNKPLHLGHLRNIFLGQSVADILEYIGNKVLKVNIVNDRGIHICKSMLAYKKWGKNKQPNKKSDHFVGDMYVLYNKHENEELKKEILDMLVKWEDKDKETITIWKKMNDWALKGMNETYKKVDLSFKKEYFESNHYDKGKKIALEGLKKGIFKKDKEGAVYANLRPYGLDDKVILRPDGTSIYITQDIYLATQRHKDYKFNKMVYVVASEQNYHFNALFSIFKMLKYPFADGCHHLSYGMVKLPHGKMKSREGTIVDADELLEEMEKLAAKEIKKRDKSLSQTEIKKRAKIIGHGALRFFLLKIDAVKDIIFNPKESLSFEGETGPYIQYAYARINSILKKAKQKGKVNTKLYDKEELELIKKLGEFSSVVESSANHMKPHMIAHYLLELTQEFNIYYNTHQILKEKKEIKEARLFLIDQIKTIIKKGLSLLHIEAPERM